MMYGVAVPPSIIRCEGNDASHKPKKVIQFLVLEKRAMPAVVKNDEAAHPEARAKERKYQRQQIRNFEAAIGEIPANEMGGNTGENLHPTAAGINYRVAGNNFLPGNWFKSRGSNRFRNHFSRHVIFRSKL